MMKKHTSNRIQAPRARAWAWACLVGVSLLLVQRSQAAQKLAEFKFDEGAGATTASTVNDLTGALGVPVDPANNPVVIPGSPGGAAGDNAVQLMGTGFLVVDDSNGPILNMGTNAFTLEAWVNIDPNNVRQYEGVLAYGSSYKLGLNNGELIFTLFGIVDIRSAIMVPLGEWHHLAAVWEPGVGVTLYLDGGSQAGGLEAFVAETRMPRAPLNTMLGVGSEGLANPISAALDRVRIHKALLTASQLDAVAATPKAPWPSTLVAYPFNESAAPFKNAVSPVRDAISYNDYLSAVSKPKFSTDTPSGQPGDFSMEFATGQRIVVPDPNVALSLDQTDSSFTLEAWVKFNTASARSVFFFNNTPGGALSFSVNTDRTVFVTTLGILDRTSSASVPNDGGWHHLAVVHEAGKEFRFYVDGLLRDTRAYTGGVLFTRTATEFYFGSEPTGGLQFVGKLDRFRYTKGILQPQELDFWPVPGLEPAAPALGIETAIKLSWPTIPAGYVLQRTFDVDEPITWTAVTNVPFAESLKYNVLLPTSSQKVFYRLVKP